jgi:hypothetical protein
MSAGQTLISANFTYNDSSIIGEGRYGVVFDGTYFGINVAVKRIQRFQVNPHEEANLRKLDHDNVIRLEHCVNNKDFRFSILKLLVPRNAIIMYKF